MEDSFAGFIAGSHFLKEEILIVPIKTEELIETFSRKRFEECMRGITGETVGLSREKLEKCILEEEPIKEGTPSRVTSRELIPSRLPSGEGSPPRKPIKCYTDQIPCKVEEFCREYVIYLIETSNSFANRINKILLLTNSFPELTQSIYYAVNSIITGKAYIPLTLHRELKHLYGALRGFLLLSFEPQYTYLQIFDILRSEEYNTKTINTAMGFIGAHLGLKKLISQGMNISPILRKKINEELSIGLEGLKEIYD